MPGTVPQPAQPQHAPPPPTLVFGTGVSGRAVERLLRSLGGTVRFADPGDLAGSAAEFAAEFPPDSPVAPSIHPVAAMSPGIPPSGPEFAAARAASLVIRGELSVGADWYRGRIVAVTGSKGKSSVVKFIADALRAYGRTAEPCGNYGKPLCDVAADAPQPEFAALECSSFQLETEDGSLRPETAILLNFSSDHIDRHGSLAAYLDAKLNVFTWPGAHCLLPCDPQPDGLPDPLAAFRKRFPGRAVETFGLSPEADWRWVPGEIVFRRQPDAGSGITADAGLADDIRLPITGSYFDNAILGPACAAACAALLRAGLSPESVAASARAFIPLPHRMQVAARSASGSVWIDNSKATNLAALVASCRMVRERPTILVCGGRIKEPLWLEGNNLVDSGVRFAYTLGECGSAMASKWRAALPVENCETLERATAAAAMAAASLGQCTVLLAPGTASFDQFRSYAERGDAFASFANSLCLRPPLSKPRKPPRFSGATPTTPTLPPDDTTSIKGQTT